MLEKLLNVYKQHDTIIIGVDFDDTIFKFSEDANEKDIIIRRKLLKYLKPYITICLYTVSDNDSLRYKIALMKEWDIEPDYINESPVKIGNGAKPFFNLLLDDKAGLQETTKVLKALKLKISIICKEKQQKNQQK